ncbi:conserved protein, unknown function [Hepatocystis sp. ex Piliocolobus tephrosceles]|nr:conserved protein, unknown function [Hepatocystis sp. ex Piliocolobus tephrosceles]
MSSSITKNKSDLLKGVGDKKTAKELLEIIMNNVKRKHFKVKVKDNRIFVGGLSYVDKYYLFLTECIEYYKGDDEPYVRDCNEIIIPLKIIKSIEIQKSYFDSCYEELKKDVI